MEKSVRSGTRFLSFYYSFQRRIQSTTHSPHSPSHRLSPIKPSFVFGGCGKPSSFALRAFSSESSIFSSPGFRTAPTAATLSNATSVFDLDALPSLLTIPPFPSFGLLPVFVPTNHQPGVKIPCSPPSRTLSTQYSIVFIASFTICCQQTLSSSSNNSRSSTYHL